MIQNGKLFGYINKTGNVIIPPRFAEDFSDGLAAVAQYKEDLLSDGEFWYINRLGEQAFQGRFSLASRFFKGLAHVRLQRKGKDFDCEDPGTFAYINARGKIVFKYSPGSCQ